MAARGEPAKKPTRKPTAKKAAAPRARRQTKAQREALEAQERALTWAVTHSAPIAVLVGWDADTGEWDPKSPIGEMIARIQRGAHINSAASICRLRRMSDVVARGREYLVDPTLSEDRSLVPLDVRPLVDLAIAVEAAEAVSELTASEKVFDSIDDDPRLGLTWLARRFPTRWSESQNVFVQGEYDPRRRAVAELLADPNKATQMAAFAREAETLAASYGDDEV